MSATAVLSTTTGDIGTINSSVEEAAVTASENAVETVTNNVFCISECAAAAAATTALATQNWQLNSCSNSGNINSSNTVCRYFLRGVCRFGPMCRFSHDPSALTAANAGQFTWFSTNNSNNNNNDANLLHQKPSTSRNVSNWVNAPEFVPMRANAANNTTDVANQNNTIDGSSILDNNACDAQMLQPKSWAEVVFGVDSAGKPTSSDCGVDNLLVSMDQQVNVSGPGTVDMFCPFESPCPYGEYCAYKLHLELCEMCDQYCLHPDDKAQRRKHKQECLQQHEQAMELSFAIARSKDKTCGICFDTIMEKVGREKRFGILPNCNHIFCLECIRKWRQAKQFEHKITRSCPECRVSSDFVCPSAFWVETKEEKDKLLNDYRAALGIKDCKYFKKGEGKCPFGNKCFYKHAMPNGDLVDVGCPKRRKLHRGDDELMDLLDIYLWEFVDQRDYHWLDFLSSESDDYDSDRDDFFWSEDE